MVASLLTALSRLASALSFVDKCSDNANNSALRSVIAEERVIFISAAILDTSENRRG